MITSEIEQYDKVCKPEFMILSNKLDAIHKQLFEGNGQPSLMAKVYGLTIKVNLILSVGSMLIGAIIVSIVTMWFSK